MDFVMIHGFILHLVRSNDKCHVSKRWAYIKHDSLFVFPNHLNRKNCLKIFLNHSGVSVSYQEDDTPWITITEYSGATYYLRPEAEKTFQNWLTAVYKASKNCKSQAVGHTMECRPNFTDQHLSKSLEQEILTSKRLNEKRSLDYLGPHYSNIYQSGNNGFNVQPSLNSAVQPINSNYLDRDSEMTHSKQKNVKHVNENTLRSKNMQVEYKPGEDKPPPRPPRNPHVLHTVKEHANMHDDEIVETKALTNVKHRYPVTGLAKRMSVAASDLLGKSRDDLILLLLQLNREKANLKRWYEYFTYQIDQIQLVKGNTKEAKSDIAVIQSELNDVIGQLKLSDPLIKFLDNMIRMGDVYGGDDVLFASEYRRHLLPSHEIVPSKPSLEFARDIEEREIARVLNNSLRHSLHRSSPLSDGSHFSQPISPISSSPSPSSSPFNNLNTSIIPKLDSMPEPVEIRLQRKRLEQELADIENLCAPHQLIHRKLKDTQKSIRLTERNKSSTEQSNKFNSKAPSATLLRRLHQDSIHNRQSKSANNSIRRKSVEPDYVEFYGDVYKRPSTAFDHYSQSSMKNKLYDIHHKHHYDQSRFMNHDDDGVEDGGDNEVDEDGIKKFRSIPENLNLFPHDSLFIQNTSKPLQDERHKPLNCNNPSDVIYKSPIRSRSYSEKPLSPSRLIPTKTTINNPLRKSFELSTKYCHEDEDDDDEDHYENNERIRNRIRKKPFREYSSDEVNKAHEWNWDLSERKTLNHIKPSHDLDNLQFKPNILSSEYSKFSAFDSNESKYGNYDRNIRSKSDNLLENIDFTTDPGHFSQGDLYRNNSVSPKKLNRNEFERNEVVKDSVFEQPSTIDKSSPKKPSSSSFGTRGQNSDAIYANLSRPSMQETKLFSETHTNLDSIPTNLSDNHNHYYRNSKRGTIVSNCSSIMEQNKIQSIKPSLLPQTNTMINKYKLNLYDSSRRSSLNQDNINSAGSLESMFTTQEQNTPDEYFIATPRSSSRKDVGRNSDIENADEIIIPRKKEDKINSLRNVLLRQSLTDSSVYNQTDDRFYHGNQLQETNTVIAERVRLMTIKQQLAKEAASTSARLSSHEHQSTYNNVSG
uniref:PH domain-containing protein n=2 Tax=Schistosoma mansoni TaxID=6183 RepID=A0A5K4FDP1_SCHMA